MPSNSLQQWRRSRRIQLDEILEAHRAVGGAGRGRRYATEQVNHAYAVLLSSQFQGFCRDLHSECVQHIVQQVPADLKKAIARVFVLDRKLDRGNPNPGNIGADFARFDFLIWDEVKRLDGRSDRRKQQLEELKTTGETRSRTRTSIP